MARPEAAAEKVADALVTRIQGRSTAHRQVLEARVVLRESTAPPSPAVA
ncbi:hypothetical protein [Modicisalibacter zincidurans]|nr:hypothetical protein [Halomonas zincidurans]